MLNINYSPWEERECTALLQGGNMKGEAFQGLHHSPINKIEAISQLLQDAARQWGDKHH